MSESRIVSARITNPPKDVFGNQPEVWIALADNPAEEERLFSFYPDEISFFPQEFIGLTKRQAYELRDKKDKVYLQS